MNGKRDITEEMRWVVILIGRKASEAWKGLKYRLFDGPTSVHWFFVNTWDSLKGRLEPVVVRISDKWDDLLIDLGYVFVDRPSTAYHDVKWFFRNLHRFCHQLWVYRPWCYECVASFSADLLSDLGDTIRDGHEVDCSRLKKAAAIDELASIVGGDATDDDYYENLVMTAYIPDWMEYEDFSFEGFTTALRMVGGIDHRFVNHASRGIRGRAVMRGARILLGQDDSLYDQEMWAPVYIERLRKAGVDPEVIKSLDEWDIWAGWFDGTGALGWWD